MSVFRSLRVRLTLWYVLLLAVTIALFSGGLYIALRQSLYENLDDSLEARADLVAGLVSDQNGELTAEGVEIPGDPDGEEFARVFDASGEVVYDNSFDPFRTAVDPEAVARALAGRRTQRSADANGVGLRVMSVPVRTESGVIGAVEVGLSDEDVRETLTSLLLVLAFVYPAALLVTSAGGVFLASRALSPIDRLTRVARKISAEDLSQRLDMPLPDDEVGRLARTFNEMIARLEDSFRRQRQFTADASHELRSPLTAIKGQTEVALQREREPGDYREVLQAVNLEVDRMIRLVASLLNLARADASQIPMNREPVSVRGLVTDAAEQIAPAAAGRVTITVQPGEDISVQADQDLLLQLMLNLLDNAVKHSGPGSGVTVSWRRDGPHVEIEVADTGAGIAPEDLAHIFDRFYRVDRARTSGGAGLGLSISRWIAEAHGGSLEARSTPGQGSVFVVRLPLT